MSRTGQTGQDGRVPAVVPRALVPVVALVGALVLAAAGVVALTDDASSADTRLAGLRGAVVLEVAGAVAPAVEGQVVPTGARVVTADGGAAVLQTRGRTVELAGGSALTVVDGAAQRLERGTVLVDASSGPDVTVSSDSADVRSRDDAVLRVERGVALRVAAYRGAAQVQASGRSARTAVPALRQVLVPLGGAAGPVGVLALVPGDPWEARPEVAGAVVALSSALDRLAGEVTDAQVVPAALQAQVADDAVAPPGERAVGLALARAAGGDARYPQVRDARRAGASWGPLAVVLDASGGAVTSQLDALLAPQLTPGLLAAAPGDAAAALDALTGARRTSPAPAAPAPRAPTAPAGPAPAPTTSTPRPAPTPSPTRPAGPLAPVTDVVGDLLDQVLTQGPLPSSGAPVLPLPRLPLRG